MCAYCVRFHGVDFGQGDELSMLHLRKLKVVEDLCHVFHWDK